MSDPIDRTTILTHACGHVATWVWEPGIPTDEATRIMAAKRCPWCGGDLGEPLDPAAGAMPDLFTLEGIGECRRLLTEEEVLPCRTIRYGERCQAPAGHQGPHYHHRHEWDDRGRRWS